MAVPYLNPDHKKTKAQVNYGKGHPTSHCGICTHFYKPNQCSLVKGSIDPQDWCNLFAKKKKAQSAFTLRTVK